LVAYDGRPLFRQGYGLANQDPVAQHLPDWPKALAEVKIQHLLSHTSGLPRLTSPILTEANSGAGRPTVPTLYRCVSDLCKPGEELQPLLSLVTDDVVFLPPNAPAINGRRAVEAMYRAFFAQFSKVEQMAVTEELEIAGEWAYAWGSESLTLTPQAGGPPVVLAGKGMTILRRQKDGAWKFARGINNLAMQTTNTPSVK
jgi:ketosteroid isomerase-like protein